MRVRFPKVSPLLLIVLGGLVLRVVWLLLAHPVPLSDYWAYQRLGAALLEHQQFGYPEPDAVRLPAYPAFLALLMLLSKSVFWLSLCNVLLSTGLIILLYELALRLSRGDQLFAHVCALVCAFYPMFIFYSPVLASEHLFTLLYFGGLLLLLRGGTAGAPPVGPTIVAGLLLGVAILTRGEAMFYLPIYWLAIFFSRASFPTRAMRGVVIVLCSALVIVPWYLRNAQLFGPGVGLSASSGLAFYFSHHRNGYGFVDPLRAPELNPGPEAPDFHQSARRGWKLGLDYLREDPAHVLRQMPIALARQYAPQQPPYGVYWSSANRVLYTPRGWERKEIPALEQLDALCTTAYELLLILAAASFVFWRLLPGPSWMLLAGVIGANWFCYCVVFSAMDRYRFTAEVGACMLAAVTVSGLWRQIRRQLPPRSGRDSEGAGLALRR